ncbi:hypothetical protein EWH99_02895 [Sporolactobacillus sp. THM7-7]|nr:hypothetical protein EWH99_02895 [Sporolactobacillus sp. THM7-7]
MFIDRPVEIRCQDGSVYHGIIDAVDEKQVYLRPFSSFEAGMVRNRSRDYPFGPGFGPEAFWGGFAGSLLGIGLSTIIGVSPYPYYEPGPYGPFPPYGPGPPYGGFYGPGPFPY